MATKLPSGTYRTQVLIDQSSRKYKSFTGKTAREADMKAEQWKLAYLRNTEGHQSFFHAATSFLEASGPSLSPYTVRGYSSTLKTIRKEHTAFSRMNLNEIRKDDLQHLVNAMLAAGKKPKTIKNYFGFISSVFSYYGIQLPKINLVI